MSGSKIIGWGYPSLAASQWLRTICWEHTPKRNENYAACINVTQHVDTCGVTII